MLRYVFTPTPWERREGSVITGYAHSGANTQRITHASSPRWGRFTRERTWVEDARRSMTHAAEQARQPQARQPQPAELRERTARARVRITQAKDTCQIPHGSSARTGTEHARSRAHTWLIAHASSKGREQCAAEHARSRVIHILLKGPGFSVRALGARWSRAARTHEQQSTHAAKHARTGAGRECSLAGREGM